MDGPPETRTSGEVAFEEYLGSQGLTEFIHEKEFPGKLKHPDYSVMIRSSEYLFEVKDIERPLPSHGYSAFDPYGPVREKIDQARKKFKEFKDYPCSLVLHLTEGLAFLTEPTVMFGAMHGDVGFKIPLDRERGVLRSDEAQLAFLRGGRMTQPHWSKPQNTTINAVITLRRIAIGEKRFADEYLAQFSGDDWMDHFHDDPGYDKQETGLGVVIFENTHATRPLPREVFTGRFDERWVVDEDGVSRVFAGDEVLERDRLDALAKENTRSLL